MAVSAAEPYTGCRVVLADSTVCVLAPCASHVGVADSPPLLLPVLPAGVGGDSDNAATDGCHPAGGRPDVASIRSVRSGVASESDQLRWAAHCDACSRCARVGALVVAQSACGTRSALLNDTGAAEKGTSLDNGGATESRASTVRGTATARTEPWYVAGGAGCGVDEVAGCCCGTLGDDSRGATPTTGRATEAAATC